MHPAIALLKKIPRGKVATYKEMARACGTSPRAVGRIMARNTDPRAFPCYKVVASSGALTGYNAPGGLAKKQSLLLHDGVGMAGGKVDKKYFHTFTMKDYSSKRVKRGRTAYRTPSGFIARRRKPGIADGQVRRAHDTQGRVPRQWGLASRLEHRRIGSKNKYRQ